MHRFHHYFLILYLSILLQQLKEKIESERGSTYESMFRKEAKDIINHKVVQNAYEQTNAAFDRLQRLFGKKE